MDEVAVTQENAAEQLSERIRVVLVDNQYLAYGEELVEMVPETLDLLANLSSADEPLTKTRLRSGGGGDEVYRHLWLLNGDLQEATGLAEAIHEVSTDEGLAHHLDPAIELVPMSVPELAALGAGRQRPPPANHGHPADRSRRALRPGCGA